MRTAKKRREATARRNGLEAGLAINFVPGSNFPSMSLWEKHNSDKKRRNVDSALFADDTTGAGKKKELDTGIEIIKEEMSRIEEMNNEDKEEILIFGTEEGDKIRMLGSYMGDKVDIQQRKKRAGNAWSKVKKQLKNSRMSKKLQARIVEAMVESTLLFDSSVRPWFVRDIKKLQSQVDKMYRHIWCKNQAPLIKMQEEGINMQDIRNKLGIKTIRWKVEKRVLQRIGHVFRMKDDRLVKNVTLGWLAELEDYPKVKGRKKKTVLYWKKLVKEAGLDYTKINLLTQDRKIWRGIVNERMKYLYVWEKGAAKSMREVARGERNVIKSFTDLSCEYCGKLCKSRAGMTAHMRTVHEISEEKVKFTCVLCKQTFLREANLINHSKNCGGAVASRPGVKKCSICSREVRTSNFARHKKNCGGLHQRVNARQARIHRPSSKECNLCGRMLSKANMARHHRSCLVGRELS